MDDYRSAPTSLTSLQDHEQLALGGLIRVLIRLDGSFTEEEEERLNAIADEVGGREELWRIISRSAQEHANDDAIKADAERVERPGVRRFIRDLLESVARADTIEPAELELLAWLDARWS